MRRGTMILAGVSLAFFQLGCGDNGSSGAECGDGTMEVDGTCVATGTGIECGTGTVEVAGECVLAGPVVECGEDTFEVGDFCVAIDPDDATAPTTTASPDEGRFRALPEGILLQTDELATIHYTTDGTAPTTSSPSGIFAVEVLDATGGTPVRFFAVDPAGNSEDEQIITYELDSTGPGAVANLGATTTGPDADVTWTNPDDTDFEGVLLIRNTGMSSSFTPEDGTFYSVGESFGDGSSVVLSSTATALADTDPGPVVHYSAWSYDDLGNYSIRSNLQVMPQLAAQTATVTVTLATGVVTVSPQPANLSLSGTTSPIENLQQGDPPGGFALSLALGNEVGRTLFAVKGVTSALTGGTFGTNPQENAPKVRFGPRGLGDGATRIRTFNVFPNAGDPAEIRFDIEFLDNPVLIVESRIIDPTEVDALQHANRISIREIGDLHGTLTAEGDKLLNIGRDVPALGLVDLTSIAPAELVALIPGFELDTGTLGLNSSSAIAQGAEATFAALAEGSHWRGTDGQGGGDFVSASTASVIRLDPATLLPTATLVLAENDLGVPVIRALSLSRDESILAVSLVRMQSNTSEIWFVNPATMGIIDADPNISGDQPLVLPVINTVSGAAWSDTTDVLYVAYGVLNGGLPTSTISVIDFATFGHSTIELGTISNATDILVRAGKIYHLASAGLAVIPESGGTPVVVDLTAFMERGPAGIVFEADGASYYVAGTCAPNTGIVLIDAATDTVIDMDGDGNNGTTYIEEACVGPVAHGMTLTPY